MDQDLVEIVTEFSPHVLNKKKKKVNLKTKENYKLSLKRIQQQPVDLPPPARPPRRLTRRTVALSESNHSSNRSSIPNVDTSRICTCRNGKENKSPCQYCVSKQLISSDDSENETGNKKSPLQNLISEDESHHQSDARHSTSTYKTCRTSQQPQEIPESSDEDVAVLQTSLKRLSFLTPDKSGVTDEPVSSCEKVHLWLTKLNISVTSTKDTSPSRRRHISETSSSGDDIAASSTAYPTITTASQRSLPTDIDSNYGTSRQSSSCVTSQQTGVFSVNTPASQPRQDSHNVTLVERRSTQISSQSSDDDAVQIRATCRESLFSSVTEISSQPTSVGTRGSSQYFIDQPPWSKQVEKPKKKTRPKISNSSTELSDIREEHSNDKKINQTNSSEESFHLVYSPTHSHISESSFYEKSLDTRIKITAKSNKPSQNKETFPDTVSWPGSSSTKSTLPPYQIPQTSTDREGSNSRIPRPSTQSTISSHAPSVASTLPWPSSSSSKSIASSAAHNFQPPTDGRAQSKEPSFASTLPWNSDSDSPRGPAETPHDFLATPEKNEKKSQPAVNSDIFNWPLYTRDEIFKIIEDVREKKKSPPKKPPSVVSVATTLPWPSDCDAPIAPSRASSSPDAPSLNQFQTSIQTKMSSTIRSSAVFSDSVHGQSYISAAHTRNVLISEEESSPNQSPEHPTTTTQVTSTKNISIIEISDDEDSSDSDEESPQRVFRKKPNRASYVEIVVSDTEYESDDVSSNKTLQKSVIPPSDSDSSGSNRGKSPIRIESSESETEYEDAPQARPPSSADSGSPVLHHSKHKRLSEISEEEDEEDPMPKHLDFSEDSSEDESKKQVTEKRPSEGRKPQRLSKSPVAVAKPVEHSPPRRRFNISSSEESDNDDKLNQFFESARRLRDKNLRRHLDEDDSPSFVVPDNEDESEFSESDEEQPSPTFYHKIHNDNRRKESELHKSWLPGNQFKKPVFTPPPLKAPPKSQTTGRCAPKPRQLGGAVFSPVLSFLQSLSATNYSRCHPEAIPYLNKFKTTRHELVARLYALFNEEVFENKLDPNMSITWNNRLRSTAGFCYNQKKAQPGADFLRTSRIELSGKILLDAGRLRDTLIHEMCHAATWVISGTLGGHGPIWKRWTYKARRRFPELPEISRCHSYKIETKYTYKCTKCSYSFGRHTKSLDLERKVCGLCRGRFEILVRGGSKAQPSPSKPPNVFALYVKEHYKVVKAGRKSLKHADVMKMLSQKFSEHKLAQKQA